MTFQKWKNDQMILCKIIKINLIFTVVAKLKMTLSSSLKTISISKDEHYYCFTMAASHPLIYTI